ncbi:anti-sigma factor domain-containing protein [Amnibacterium flavum]|uniref:Regulator of SigK n=1 Tax=Amnibacterium flavum TaxID=2173173 RepID=A0A2V1HTH8_9MICO|nr:anti-sigma factor [Amnibacterium flavum]PVZ94982.1 hypothetical protein DDQ50_00115 [Amnibacterium flavum]
MTDRHQLDDSASGAYSLDALEGAERDAFERRLRDSEDLRAEVAGFTDTAALLAGATTPVAPPARLKASLFARLDSTPQIPAATPATDIHAVVTSVEPEPAAQAAPVVPTAIGSGQHLVRSRRVRPLRRRLVSSILAVAAAVALFAGGIVAGDFITGGTQSSTQAEQLASLIGSDDVTRSTVALPDGTTASLLASADLELSAVVLSDSPQLASGETYQAWFVREDGAHSAAVMDPKSDEKYMLLDHYQADDRVALTVEPVGGSKQPTTDPIVFESA